MSWHCLLVQREISISNKLFLVAELDRNKHVEFSIKKAKDLELLLGVKWGFIWGMCVLKVNASIWLVFV